MKSAESFYRLSIKLDPNYTNSYIGLANLLTSQEKFEEAEKLYLRAIEIDPQYSWTYNNLGQLYFTQKSYTKAENLWLQSLKLDPKNFYTLDNLGKLAEDKKDFVTAENFYLQSLKINPNFLSPLLNLATLKFIIQKDYARSTELLERAILLAPESGELRADLALSLLRQGNREAALRVGKKAVELGFKGPHDALIELKLTPELDPKQELINLTPATDEIRLDGIVQSVNAAS